MANFTSATDAKESNAPPAWQASRIRTTVRARRFRNASASVGTIAESLSVTVVTRQDLMRREAKSPVAKLALQHLIWRGVGSKTLDPKAKPEKRQKNLTKAVAELMKKYPPPK